MTLEDRGIGADGRRRSPGASFGQSLKVIAALVGARGALCLKRRVFKSVANRIERLVDGSKELGALIACLCGYNGRGVWRRWVSLAWWVDVNFFFVEADGGGVSSTHS